MELSERCIQTLEKEGFPYVYEWQDKAGVMYPVHTHKDKVTLFVTEGMLTLTMGDKIVTLLAGDRLDIPPGTPHHGVVGIHGCQYVVGEVIDGDF